jgi:hypothetical protein
VSAAQEGTGKAQYVGTEVDGRWWKRYRAAGFFARGNGSFRFADGEQLSSGFGFADRPSADAFVAELQARRSGTG